SFRERLHAALMEAKQANLADALGHSELSESQAEIVFTTPKMYQMFLKDSAFDAAVKRVAGRPVRVTIKVGEPARSPAPETKAEGSGQASPSSATSGPAAERALEHPEVQKFQELFPGSQIRAVR